jgi:ATP/maltotriose-dependent transcriptional regulator MalT
MRITPLMIPVLAALLGCDLSSDPAVGREAPAAAAVLAPGQDVHLLDMLRMVEVELDLALAGEPARAFTAEAMTDQLLHAPRDVDWLATGYSVEARLRQIQAKADAIVALLRRGATPAAVEPELSTLRAAVRDLQEQLQLPGGGPAPPTLETLLAQDPLRDARAPVGIARPATESPDAEPVGQPLGTPVGPPPNGTD